MEGLITILAAYAVAVLLCSINYLLIAVVDKWIELDTILWMGLLLLAESLLAAYLFYS